MNQEEYKRKRNELCELINNSNNNNTKNLRKKSVRLEIERRIQELGLSVSFH